jgi:low affinity Fe/Cu permease
VGGSPSGERIPRPHTACLLHDEIFSVTIKNGGTSELTVFDRFASGASDFVSRAWFFVICVLLVAVWAPSYFLFANVDTWQLIINTATTIVTFLLVALLQNTQKRSDDASQYKLNAIADALADLMEGMAREYPGLEGDCSELRAAVGLEKRQGTGK